MTQVPASPDLTAAPTPAGLSRRNIVLVSLGAAFEGFDFTLYALFAPAIAATFFPRQDPIAGLLATFLVFVVAFLARPVGGVVLGWLVDRRGRKPVMLASMVLMAFGSLLIGISPSYATAGAAGAVIVVIGRACQGLSLGGEQGSAGMFIGEWAPQGRRGYYTSALNTGGTGGVILAALVGALLTTLLGQDTITAWAWRIPFFLGAGLAVVVFFLRRGLQESPRFRADESAADAHAPTTSTRMPNGTAFFVALGVIALWTTTVFTTLVYMPTYAFAIVGVNASGALWATAFGAALTVALTPVGGWISDRVGRRRVLLFSVIGYLICAYPLFALVATTKELWAVLVLEGVLAIFSGPIAGIALAIVIELFHGRRHGLLVTATAALGSTIFGGFGPYVCTWLISVTGQPVAASYWVIAMALLTLIAAFFLPRDLHRRELA